MQNSAVEACSAHNPEVRGSKPRSAIFSFFSYSGPGSVMVSHLTPDQKVIGSNPIWVNSISFFILSQLVLKMDKRFLNRKRFDCAKSILFAKKRMPQPGIEPGFLRPQRTVLTTRLLRQLLSNKIKTVSLSPKVIPLRKHSNFFKEKVPTLIKMRISIRAVSQRRYKIRTRG